MLLHVVLCKVAHNQRQNGLGLARGNLVEHLDDRHLAAVLQQVFGSLGAHQATANDGDAARKLHLAGQHVPARDDLLRIGTRNGDDHVMRAHSHNRGVGGVEVLSGSGMVELNLHSQAGQNLLVVLNRAHDLVLARRRGRQHNLAAQMIARLVDGHTVAALGRHACGLQAGNTAAHHGDLLVALARLDGDGRLVAVLGVEHARDVLAILNRVDAALVAVEALADGLTRGGLQRNVGVAHERAAIGDDVGRAVFQNLLAGLDRDNTADGCHRHGDQGLDALGHGQRPVVGHGAHGRNGIAHVAGVVGLRDLDHVDAGALEQLGELAGLVGLQAALAARRAVGVLHDHGELVLHHQLRRGFLNGGDDLQRVADAVLERATVLVGALVEDGRAQRTHQAVAVDLDGVDAGLLRASGRGGDGLLDLGELLYARLVHKVLHVVMQLGVGLVADLVGLGHLGGKGFLVAGGLGLLRGLGGGHGSHDHAADTGHIVLGVEQLQRDLGAVLVDGIGQSLKRGDLGVGRQLGRGACGHDGSDVADDDVAHAATGQALVKSQAALANGTVALLVAGGQRREHNAVLELKGTNRNGLEQLGCRCGHGYSSLVSAAAMLPRSCLEDMAWEHGGTTEIGGQRVAAGGWGGAARRFVSICNSYAAKPGLTVTDRDKPNPPARKSQSITTTRQNPSLVLQI